jgi:hypothetical protein
MATMGVPTELRSRTLHHTGDLRQLVNTTYNAHDFIDPASQRWTVRGSTLKYSTASPAPSGFPAGTRVAASPIPPWAFCLSPAEVGRNGPGGRVS